MPIRRDVIQRLRDGKAALRESRRTASLEDKLRELSRAQRVFVEITRTRRALRPIEQPWDILSDVQDDIVIKDDGSVERTTVTKSAVSASSSQWVRPFDRWILAS